MGRRFKWYSVFFFYCGIKYDVRDFSTCTFFWSKMLLFHCWAHWYSTSLLRIKRGIVFVQYHRGDSQESEKTHRQPSFTLRLLSRRSDVKMITAGDCCRRFSSSAIFVVQTLPHTLSVNLSLNVQKSATIDSHRSQQTTWVIHCTMHTLWAYVG